MPSLRGARLESAGSSSCEEEAEEEEEEEEATGRLLQPAERGEVEGRYRRRPSGEGHLWHIFIYKLAEEVGTGPPQESYHLPRLVLHFLK